MAATPVDERHKLKSGKFESELAVTTRNADARRYRVVVSFDGSWGDSIWDHLKVDAPELLKRRDDNRSRLMRLATAYSR